jgi:hypothetical protein
MAEDDAEVFLKIAWYAVDNNDLHQTTLKQKWHDFKGTFQLVEETRIDGDLGLLGEALPPAPAPSGTARRAQFPTIRLGQPQQAKTEPSSEEAPPPAEQKEP